MDVAAFFTLNSHDFIVHELPWLWLLVFIVTVSLLYLSLHIKLSKRQYINSPSMAQTSLFEFLRNRHRLLEWQTDILSSSRSQSVRISVVPGGIPGVVTSNPANVEYVLKTNFDNYPKGKRFRFLFHDFLGRGIFNADGELWKMQRKAATYEFNTKSLRSFVVETVQWEIRNRLMVVLHNACQRGEPVDLQDILQRFSFDNICRVAFGVDPRCLDPSLPTSRIAEAFDSATEISFGRFLSIAPEVMVGIKRLLNVGSERRLREALRVVDEFVEDVIRSRKELHGDIEIEQEHLDLLSRFMAAVDDKRYNHELKLLKEMVVSIMLAGRDTTAAALTWFFWLLSSHPRVEEAIRHEILGVLAERGVDKGEVEELSGVVLFNYEEVKGMPYLHAALCESMRLYPPVPVDTKIASRDDVLPDGTCVRKGWLLCYNIYSMGRMESIWGRDFLEFRPERWLNGDGNFEVENSFKFPVFNAGPRICLGKEMAFIQMKSIVASLLHHFTLKMDKEYRPQYTLSITLRMKGGLPVIVTSV
jgi:cytochrome P450